MFEEFGAGNLWRMSFWVVGRLCVSRLLCSFVGVICCGPRKAGYQRSLIWPRLEVD